MLAEDMKDIKILQTIVDEKNKKIFIEAQELRRTIKKKEVDDILFLVANTF